MEGKNPALNVIADCLDRCEKRNRCYSGACLECGRLFQRFYVRRSKQVIRDIIARKGKELIWHLHNFIIPTCSSWAIKPFFNRQFYLTSIYKNRFLVRCVGTADFSVRSTALHIGFVVETSFLNTGLLIVVAEGPLRTTSLRQASRRRGGNWYRESVVEIFALMFQRLQGLGQRCRFAAKSREVGS